MKKALLASAACAALGVASMASAAVTAKFVDMGVPSAGSFHPATHNSWVIQLVSDGGAITAVDAQSTGNGITGPLVQKWTASDPDFNPGVYDKKSVLDIARNATAASGNFDSHLLPIGAASGADMLGQIGFDESMGSGTFIAPPGGLAGFPANTAGTGYGQGVDGSIKGAYGIAGPAQASTIDLAYVVAPVGTVDFGQVTVSVGQEKFAIPLRVPEPGTLSLAGLGVLGLVARRRR